MDPHPRTVPRALHRARLWTAGLLTASTLLVGGLGVHLAENRTVVSAQSSTTGTTSVTSVTSDDDGSDDSTVDDSGSNGTAANQPGGFGNVPPLQGSNAQSQSNTKAS
ncbi:MAG: hypothetical protein ABIS35_13055 [Terracoccus sp.]